MAQQRTALDAEACVLVVDDDAGIRETLRLMLEDAGYSAAEAGDGMAALAVLRSSARPLVVLLDVMLPRLDGIGVLRAVASDPGLARVHHYIVISANLHTYIPALHNLQYLMDIALVAKPFDVDALLELVDRAVLRLPDGTGRGADDSQTSSTCR